MVQRQGRVSGGPSIDQLLALDLHRKTKKTNRQETTERVLQMRKKATQIFSEKVLLSLGMP